ncbi:MAG: hypothetical protein OHK0044_16800 [Burkholderiaceae bacterium]
MHSRPRAALAALLALFAAPVAAQTIAAKGGTTGLGAELAWPLTERFAARLWANGGSLSRDLTESGIRYDVKLKFGAAFALADLHPFAGSFRVSAGLAYNDNRFDFTGRGDGSTIEINGVPYNSADVGTLDGRVRFDKTSPYLGIGWGSAPRGAAGFGATIDLGVMFQKTRASLTGTCGPSLPAPVCAQLQNDLSAEEAQFRDAVDSFKAYPVVSVGLSYRF